ncbi:SMI1/KNR4 family protein [Desulfitobacterium sp. Sab5]|uniref:SMI1/KNR4 family protein n=1 Tax=Desulfitobacterium nosdiversum TaxID=3375356 RepID=UPI003CF353B9
MEIQNNSLQKEIRELQELCKRMEDMEMNESRFNPPVTEEEILDWERTNGIAIPESYKEWLRFSNGSQILGMTARLSSLKGMVIKNEFIPEDMVIIGHLGGSGEIVCFSKTTGKIVRLFDREREEFDSFKDILLDLIQSGKSMLGEDETTNKLGAMMLAMLEAKKNSAEGLTEEQAKALAMLESKKKWKE